MHQFFAYADDVDSDALKTFLTVYREGGISSAARALHRTQPAISRRIALLEQELGVPLFERGAGGLLLSDAGRVMVPYAERAIAATQDAENAVRALSKPNAGPVALAIVGTLAGRRVARLADLRQQRWIAFPEVPGRREIAAGHILALFQVHRLGDVTWTPVDSLTAQKRLIEAGLGLALLSVDHAAEELESGALATIGVGDLKAEQEIVTVTRRGGFLSAASAAFLDMLRADYLPRRQAPRRRTGRR
jgi:DNA-binding transcriptional LysR family regulator